MNAHRFLIHLSQAYTAYRIECLGDALAKEHNYPSSDGINAVWIYLSKKYGWTIPHCRSLCLEDLELALELELKGFSMPADARFQWRLPTAQELVASKA
ncbi:hypothetical protein DDO12_09310 [Vibrio cholerae]|nr:hypothetical protein [Vibrio cholerae]QHQ92723.1 hypothetical protein FKV26_19115 [Vibrio cholerae O1]EGR4477810.1 hypothetical protein [Vibrio cholerae]MCX9579152.1 hypothetical protein [Vibrio cholerae]MCX9590538.1 hypothetical protein [Vibrio cholerae]